jgi:hypothetical protein
MNCEIVGGGNSNDEKVECSLTILPLTSTSLPI